MENASKALLIAAAVLIVILLIAFGMKIFNDSASMGDETQAMSDTLTSGIDKGNASIENASLESTSQYKYIISIVGKETMDTAKPISYTTLVRLIENIKEYNEMDTSNQYGIIAAYSLAGNSLGNYRTDVIDPKSERTPKETFYERRIKPAIENTSLKDKTIYFKVIGINGTTNAQPYKICIYFSDDETTANGKTLN